MEYPIPNEVALTLYEKIVRIRKFEEAVVDLYARGKIPGFLHTYIGEEAVAAGVCTALRKDDKITSTHRGHGHLIAKGARFDKAMAELFGKATGYNKGKGGSMHIAEPDLGMLGANAIVSAGIATATGAALTAQYLQESWVVVAFFGDGASNEGTFHESLNLASVWNLPVVYVCENNEYAESTPRCQHQKIKDVAVRANSYAIPGVIVDGNDVGAVYLCAKEAIERARSGEGPTLLEAKTTRWRGHHEADNQNYRPKDELQSIRQNDAVARWKSVLLARGNNQEKMDEIETQTLQELKEAVEFAEKSPLPDPADALSDIFTPFSDGGLI
jgi:acetoin:2,6-dichlorophenolindophenol oxidoreductase subunit alpha